MIETKGTRGHASGKIQIKETSSKIKIGSPKYNFETSFKSDNLSVEKNIPFVVVFIVIIILIFIYIIFKTLR